MGEHAGMVRPTTREEVVERARRMAGEAGKDIRYWLKDFNGGRDPYAPDPATHWKTKVLRRRMATCDCAGFVAWCCGYAREQPGFMGGWGWVNTDSMIAEARVAGRWFQLLARPEFGCVVAYQSIDFDRDGDRDRVGHMGIVVGMVDEQGRPLPAIDWRVPRWDRLRVVHCSLSNERQLGRAIAETSASAFAGAATYRGKSRVEWGAVFLDYQRLAELRAA